MKLTKSKLKQIIKEEISGFRESDEDIRNLPPSMSAHRFSSTPVKTLSDFAGQEDQIKDLINTAVELREKINKYIEDYENVGPPGQGRDYGGLSEKWIDMLDILETFKAQPVDLPPEEEEEEEQVDLPETEIDWHSTLPEKYK